MRVVGLCSIGGHGADHPQGWLEGPLCVFHAPHAHPSARAARAAQRRGRAPRALLGPGHGGRVSRLGAHAAAPRDQLRPPRADRASRPRAPGHGARPASGRSGRDRGALPARRGDRAARGARARLHPAAARRVAAAAARRLPAREPAGARGARGRRGASAAVCRRGGHAATQGSSCRGRRKPWVVDATPPRSGSQAPAGAAPRAAGAVAHRGAVLRLLLLVPGAPLARAAGHVQEGPAAHEPDVRVRGGHDGAPSARHPSHAGLVPWPALPLRRARRRRRGGGPRGARALRHDRRGGRPSRAAPRARGRDVRALHVPPGGARRHRGGDDDRLVEGPGRAVQ